MEKDKRRKLLTALGAVFLAAAMFLLGWFAHWLSLGTDMRRFLWAKGVAEGNYIDWDEDRFYEDLFGVLDLDPYSGFYTPQGSDAYMAESAGQNMGVGLSLMEETEGDKKYSLVFSAVENSPAERAGVERGMYILGYGKSHEEALEERTDGNDGFISFLSGCAAEEDFFLRCGYAKEEDGEVFTLKRSSYQAAYAYYADSGAGFRFTYEKGQGFSHREVLASLEARGKALPLLGEETAYIRIERFGGYVSSEMAACLDKMKERGRKNLVLDLRSNGGGYLSDFQSVASHLLKNAPELSPIVATAEYRDGKKESYRAAKSDYAAYFGADSRVLILADEYTASASECLIGALVSYGTTDYSEIILRKGEEGASTYGKGIMQSHFSMFLDGSMMKVTTARMYWPNGRCIHGVGITEADGARAVEAPLVPGEEDPMLAYAAGLLKDN